MLCIHAHRSAPAAENHKHSPNQKMLQLASLATTAIITSAFAWSAFWSTDRVVSYFTKNEEQNAQGLKEAVLPSDDSADPSVLEGFRNVALKP